VASSLAHDPSKGPKGAVRGGRQRIASGRVRVLPGSRRRATSLDVVAWDEIRVTILTALFSDLELEVYS
jgi:hypothetical protein